MAVRRKRDASAAPRRAQPESPSRRASARKRGGASGRVLAKLRAICLALPEAQEKLSHGEPTWFAGKGKVFAMFDDHHHGAPHVSVWLPLPPGLQEALIELDLRSRLREISVPTLVVHGAYDTGRTIDHAQILLEGIREAELVVMDESGHSPMVETPAAFSQALNAFLDKVNKGTRQTDLAVQN